MKRIMKNILIICVLIVLGNYKIFAQTVEKQVEVNPPKNEASANEKGLVAQTGQVEDAQGKEKTSGTSTNEAKKNQKRDDKNISIKFDIKNHITIQSGGTFNSTRSEIILNQGSNSLTFKNNWNGKEITIKVNGRNDATFSSQKEISNLSEINEIIIQGIKVTLIHPTSAVQVGTDTIAQQENVALDNSQFKIQDIVIISGGKFNEDNNQIELTENSKSLVLKNNWNQPVSITFGNDKMDSIEAGREREFLLADNKKIIIQQIPIKIIPHVISPSREQISERNWVQYFIFAGVLLATLAGLFFFLKSKKRKQKTQEVSIKDSIQYRGKADTPIEQKQPFVSQTSATATRISEDEKRKIEFEVIRNLKAGTIPSHLSNDFEEIKRNLEQEVSTKLISTTSTQINDLRNTKDKEIQTLKSQFLSAEQKFIDEKTSLISQISQLNSTAQNLNSKKTDLQRKLELSQPYSTEMQTFFNALEYSYAQLKNMASTANKNSRFYPTLSYILQGQSSRSTNAVFDVVKYNDGLMEVLGVNNLRDLKLVSKETFFNRYINNYFERTLTQIAQLNAYANADNSLNTASEIEKDGLGEIKNVFSVLNKAVAEFGYRMIEPKLGEDHYDDNKHQKSNNSTLIHIAPEKIESVSSGKIYDIARIGFETLSGSTSVKTTVVCKL